MQPVNPPQRMDNKKKTQLQHTNKQHINKFTIAIVQCRQSKHFIFWVRMVKLVKILKNKINLFRKYSRKYLQFRMKFKAKHQSFSNSNRYLIDNSKIRFSFENHLRHFYENTNICFYFFNFV